MRCLWKQGFNHRLKPPAVGIDAVRVPHLDCRLDASDVWIREFEFLAWQKERGVPGSAGAKRPAGNEDRSIAINAARNISAPCRQKSPAMISGFLIWPSWV